MRVKVSRCDRTIGIDVAVGVKILVLVFAYRFPMIPRGPRTGKVMIALLIGAAINARQGTSKLGLL